MSLGILAVHVLVSPLAALWLGWAGRRCFRLLFLPFRLLHIVRFGLWSLRLPGLLSWRLLSSLPHCLGRHTFMLMFAIFLWLLYKLQFGLWPLQLLGLLKWALFPCITSDLATNVCMYTKRQKEREMGFRTPKNSP